MNVYIIILIIIILALLFIYINTYKKLKVVQNENKRLKRDIKNKKGKNDKDMDKNDEILDQIYISNRKIAFYSGILSEKPEKYKENEYLDIIKREADTINKNLKIFKNKHII